MKRLALMALVALAYMPNSFADSVSCTLTSGRVSDTVVIEMLWLIPYQSSDILAM